MSSPPSEDSFIDLYNQFFRDDGAEEEEAVTSAATLATSAMNLINNPPHGRYCLGNT